MSVKSQVLDGLRSAINTDINSDPRVPMVTEHVALGMVGISPCIARGSQWKSVRTPHMMHTPVMTPAFDPVIEQGVVYAQVLVMDADVMDSVHHSSLAMNVAALTPVQEATYRDVECQIQTIDYTKGVLHISFIRDGLYKLTIDLKENKIISFMLETYHLKAGDYARVLYRNEGDTTVYLGIFKHEDPASVAEIFKQEQELDIF